MKFHFEYLRILFFRILEKIINRHHVSRQFFFKKYKPLISWLGSDDIHLEPKKIYKKKYLKYYYSQLKGDVRAVKIISQEKISYDDHLPRIRTNGEAIETAVFTRPSLSSKNPRILNLSHLSSAESINIKNIVKKHPYFSEAPRPFSYSEMEAGASLNKPVFVGLPDGLNSYCFNQYHELSINVLHLPIKITRKKSLELYKQGRIVSSGNNAIDHHHLYIPDNLSYITPLVKYVCGLELMFNPYFVDDYYIFVTVSNTIVPTNAMQRRGGWHIDGHQGSERVQHNGKKLPCDRQYIICNTLPTESIQHNFDFSAVKSYCKKQFCHIDSVNMQDVIENEISKTLSNGNQTLFSIEPHKLFFLNPYMVHKAKINTGKPQERTFLRILVSSFKRDRLGDTVNPVIGPLWRYKIKTITDIHEMDHNRVS